MDARSAVAVSQLDDVHAGHARLGVILDDLDDVGARQASALPGWTRGHVLTHLAEHARALTRQVEFAIEGRLVDFYDGGAAGRNAVIEAGSGRPAAELRADVVSLSAALESAWARVRPDGWASPVRYRNGTVLDTVSSRWREVEIHTADLLLGYTSADWAPEFCDYLVEFTAPRVPEGVEVQGALTDIAAWMAGRETIGMLTVAGGVGVLPELGTWP
jgi:maleylpyruvate isomerase